MTEAANQDRIDQLNDLRQRQKELRTMIDHATQLDMWANTVPWAEAFKGDFGRGLAKLHDLADAVGDQIDALFGQLQSAGCHGAVVCTRMEGQ